MKKNIQIRLIIGIIGIITTLNVFYILKKEISFSNLALVNLEVLAQNETDEKVAIYSCYLKDFTHESGTIPTKICENGSNPYIWTKCKQGRMLIVPPGNNATGECYLPYN